MFTFQSQLLLSLFIMGAATSPVEDAGPSSPQASGFAVKLSRRSFGQQEDSDGIPLFNSTFMKQDFQRVMAKYAQASDFLQGIGLAPEANFTSYSGSDNFTTSSAASNNSDSNSNGTSGDDSLLSAEVVAAANTNTAMMPMTDYISGTTDILYYGPLNFGTPAQSLTVDVDTGSADLWMPVNCRGCPNRQFNAKASSTYKNNGTSFQVTYGSGQVSGTLATDVVSVSGLSVPSQAFGAVTQESAPFNEFPNDGLIGMAFGTIASSKKPTFFENLMSMGKVATQYFSIHLTRGSATGSEVCFGCVDSTKTTGAVSWVPVTSKTYWAVSLDRMVVNSTSTARTSIYAAIDTGTTLIYVPNTIGTQFYNLIPGAKSASQYGQGMYTYPCKSKLNIAFSFGGQQFSINQVDFNLLGLALGTALAG